MTKYCKTCGITDDMVCPRVTKGIGCPDAAKSGRKEHNRAIMNTLWPDDDQRFKADGGKPDPTLLEQGCTKALMVVQATLDYGKIKYEAHSWKNVHNGIARYDAAARRHRIQRDLGNSFDAESGLAHLAHEIINNLFLLEMLIEADPGCTWTEFRQPPQDHKEIDHDDTV